MLDSVFCRVEQTCAVVHRNVSSSSHSCIACHAPRRFPKGGRLFSTFFFFPPAWSRQRNIIFRTDLSPHPFCPRIADPFEIRPIQVPCEECFKENEERFTESCGKTRSMWRSRYGTNSQAFASGGRFDLSDEVKVGVESSSAIRLIQ